MTREQLIEAFKPYPVQLVFRDQSNIFMPDTVVFSNYESDPITIYIYPLFFEMKEQHQTWMLEHKIVHIQEKMKHIEQMSRAEQKARTFVARYSTPVCDSCGNSGAPCVRCGTK